MRAYWAVAVASSVPRHSWLCPSSTDEEEILMPRSGSETLGARNPSEMGRTGCPTPFPVTPFAGLLGRYAQPRNTLLIP